MKVKIKSSDVYLRVLSLVIAVIFWLFAKQNVQIPNISERQQYQKVMKKVVFTDIEEGLTVTSEVPEVFLELSGPFWEMTQNQEQIMVVASLKSRRAGRHSIDVSVRVPENVNIIQYYPETIDVRLESLTTKKLELQNLNLGNLPQGRELQNLSITPTEVAVSGPDSLLGTAQSATVTLELRDLSVGEHKLSLPIQIRNASGALLSGLGINPTHAEVRFEVVEKALRTVPVELDFEVESVDLEELEVTVIPKEVSLVGDRQIEAVSSEPFVVSEIPFRGEVKLVVPSGSQIWPETVEVLIAERIPEEEEQ